MTKMRRLYRVPDWDSAYKLAIDKQIEQEDVTNEQFIDDLRAIESCCTKSVLTQEFDWVKGKLDSMLSYDKESEYGYAFIDSIHTVAGMIREAEKLEGFNKLKKQIFTDRGLFEQFKITVFLSRYFTIDDIEVQLKKGRKSTDVKPFDADLVIAHGNKRIYVQIKDIREERRMDRIDDAQFGIESTFYERSKGMKDNRWVVTNFDGTPPANVPHSFWAGIGSNVELKNKKHVIKIKKNQFGKHEARKIKFTTKLRPLSDNRVIPAASFNNSKRFTQVYNETQERVENTSSSDDESFVVLVITNDDYLWPKQVISEVERSGLGIIVIRVMGLYIMGNSLLLPKNSRKFLEEFTSKVPVSYHFE